jgi:hypothetical protein
MNAYLFWRAVWAASILTVLALIAMSSAHADDWTTETKVEEILYQSLHVVDSAQTVYIAGHPDQYFEKESAWAIGRHPSEAYVIKFMATESAIHVAVTAALVTASAPRWLTRTWELLTIGDSAHCVFNNHSIGIQARF